MTRNTALLAIFMAAATLASPARATDDLDPVAIVKHTTSSIFQTLDANRAAYAEDPEALRAMVREDLLPLIDLDYSARLILGKSGRGVSDAELKAFSNAMSDVLINRYADGLLEFRSDEQVEVLPMKGDNSDRLTRVRTRIKLDNGNFAPVDYSFRKTDEGWKAFDVMVEGISYVITLRNQISPRVEADGIAKVTAEIVAGNLQVEE